MTTSELIGLRPGVYALDELGFFYVDDGKTTLRLRSDFIRSLRSGNLLDPHFSTAEFLRRYGNFFAEYENAQDAEISYRAALAD